MNKTPVKVLQPSKEDELKFAQFNKSSTVVDDEWMLLASLAKHMVGKPTKQPRMTKYPYKR